MDFQGWSWCGPSEVMLLMTHVARCCPARHPSNIRSVTQLVNDKLSCDIRSVTHLVCHQCRPVMGRDRCCPAEANRVTKLVSKLGTANMRAPTPSLSAPTTDEMRMRSQHDNRLGRNTAAIDLDKESLKSYKCVPASLCFMSSSACHAPQQNNCVIRQQKQRSDLNPHDVVRSSHVRKVCC